uniref:ANK_REP_REGION domain-containing protein n=1 Tax=Strongyloides stercoralis TaxID=6248 RepID=A0A0K0EHS3_STRER
MDTEYGGKFNLNEDNEKEIYTLVGMNNEGELINWMRYSLQSGDYSIIDEYIEKKLIKFMYNDGKGKIIHISELLKIRQIQRLNQIKKGKGKNFSSNIENKDINELNFYGKNQNNIRKALKMIDGEKGDAKHREIIWKLEERGFIGETIIGVCMLKGSPIHCLLAKRIVKRFPKLVNDFMISEEYYGLSPLHQSIINDNLEMTYFLLKNGADINQRCYGAFFSTIDQRNTRWDNINHEYVEMSLDTNYEGKTYMGEYPLSFASSTNKLDFIRLLRAFKADPIVKDYNGNTPMHMAVIHEQGEAINLLYDLGGKLTITNKLNLTPLTLSAKLGKKSIFERIINLERSIVSKHGNFNSFSYPLVKIDSIDQDTGKINYESALSLIVYGRGQKHLEMLDGLLEELLKAKWDSFGRRKLIKSFIFYFIYYCFFVVAFISRPGITLYDTCHSESSNTILNKSEINNEDKLINFTTRYDNFYCIRFIFELLVSSMALIQVILEIFDLKHLGFLQWWNIYKAFPEKLMYKVSLIMILIMTKLRVLCYFGKNTTTIEDFLGIISVLLTTINFLFYCRAIKYVGAFVLIIYDIIAKDMLRFIIIYSIFLIGFSQAFYILFTGCVIADQKQNNRTHICDEDIYKKIDTNKNINDYFTNIMCRPHESILRLFIMTLGEFAKLYSEINNCPNIIFSVIGKILFFMFELIVSIMLFNVLIAMMTRTYESVESTNNEYKRQLAKVILATEVSMSSNERKLVMLHYSKPIDTNRRKRAFIINKKGNFNESKSKYNLYSNRILLEKRLKKIKQTKENNYEL